MTRGKGESLGELLTRFKAGDRRALGRCISMSEDKDPRAVELLKELYPRTGRARIVGLTGAPGAGKSSLVNAFVKFLRTEGNTVGVIAVDPVSPFSGGALLGDRIRLSEHFNDPGVFIRSLSTRGKLGGLSLATREVVHLVDAFGLDYVIVETVGVGQSEVDVRGIADTVMVVVVPEWGDGVQAIKAGILEIGDMFVVNKADREGADRVATELRQMLQMAGRNDSPVTTTQALVEASARACFDELVRFMASRETAIRQRREERARETVADLLAYLAAREARRWVAEHAVDAKNPYEFVETFLKTRPGGLFAP